VSLANRGVKALSLEARSDPAAQSSMQARRERLASAGVADLEAMGWDDAQAAAQLLGAMTHLPGATDGERRDRGDDR
jgi:TetR/AcrR family transcriptional regulator, transcriptional repressor for nem operon